MDQLEQILKAVRDGELDVERARKRLRAWPVLDLGHTRLDTHRELRCGQPETVYGAGKTPVQLVEIAQAVLEHHDRLLITRVTDAGAKLLLSEVPGTVHDELARTVSVEPTIGSNGAAEPEGLVAIVSAGTSDAPVVAEACVTLRLHGARFERFDDVGVAGIHRVLEHVEALQRARALIVVAGMEGALPSVVGGLVDRPVIAVPTSVGYGASFGGVTALLGMLNSCAAGVSVVNIDNGFGAGCIAAMINRGAHVKSEERA